MSGKQVRSLSPELLITDTRWPEKVTHIHLTTNARLQVNLIFTHKAFWILCRHLHKHVILYSTCHGSWHAVRTWRTSVFPYITHISIYILYTEWAYLECICNFIKKVSLTVWKVLMLNIFFSVLCVKAFNRTLPEADSVTVDFNKGQ